MGICYAWTAQCQIDWDAFAAVATAAAVVTALWIARAEGRERQRREDAESRLIGQYLSYYLKRRLEKLADINPVLDTTDDSGGISAAFIARDGNIQREIATTIGRAATSMHAEITRLEPRMHVIPHAAARTIMGAYLAVRRVSDLANDIRDSTASRETKTTAAEALRSDYKGALKAIARSRDACNALSLGAKPATRWQRLEHRFRKAFRIPYGRR